MPSKTQLPLFPDFEELLKSFNDEGVDYLLIGGYAVMVHAQPRATKDLDIFVRCDVENSSAVWRALAKFGIDVSGLEPDYFASPGAGYRMGRPPIMAEILTHIDGIEFGEARAHASTEAINEAGLQVPIISAGDLITNKLAAGRLQDLADVEAIRNAIKAGDAPEEGTPDPDTPKPRHRRGQRL